MYDPRKSVQISRSCFCISCCPQDCSHKSYLHQMQALLQLYPCCRFCFLSHNHILPDSFFHRPQVKTALHLYVYGLFVLYNAVHRILLQEMQPFHRSSHRPFRQIPPSPEAPIVSCSHFEYGSFPDFAHSEIHRSTRNYLHYCYVSFRYDTYMHI